MAAFRDLRCVARRLQHGRHSEQRLVCARRSRRTAMRVAYCDTEQPESHLTQSRIGVSAISRSGFLCASNA